GPGLLKQKMGAAVWISHVSIVVPFLSGMALSIFLYARYATGTVAFAPFALFLGTSMSITAFPVLARIIHEKNLTRSPIRAMPRACGAVDAVPAGCALAAVAGYVRHGSAVGAFRVAGLCLAWTLAMTWIARPALSRWIGRREDAADLGHEATAAALFFALVS